MYGNLFVYEKNFQLVAFESGSLDSSQCLIILGGLTDGLLSLPYIDNLSSSIQSKSYSLIQPLLRSSYFHYGWHSIDDDVQDLKSLIDYLNDHRKHLESIVLMGHSTGCQDIVHYLRQQNIHPKIHRVILQGPVSDREYASTLESTKDQLNFCYQNRKTNSNEWLPRSLHQTPLTIQRCLSLNERNSIEDLFSSDLTDEELNNIYANIHLPILWIWSKQDHYVPDNIREHVCHFVRSRLANKPNSTFVLLENADHAVSQQQDQISMIEHIIQFIS